MTIPSMEEVRGWGVDQVQEYLKQAGLGDCCDILLRKQVDGLALLGMNDAVLQMWSRDMKIMQIKKLSKLVSQLTSTTMQVSKVSYSPAVPRQRRHMSGSVGGSSENEWGSDFEDSSDSKTQTTQNQTRPVTGRKVTPIQNKIQNSKVSLNQVPKPYKPPPSSIQKVETIKTEAAFPEYSNVKKASLALNKSTISSKISTLEKKALPIEKINTGNLGNTKVSRNDGSPKSTPRPKTLAENIDNTSSSVERTTNATTSTAKTRFAKHSNNPLETSKSNLSYKNPKPKSNAAKTSPDATKNLAIPSSPEVLRSIMKNHVKNTNISKSLPEHVKNKKPNIPIKNLVVKSTVDNICSNSMEKNAKKNYMNGKESLAKGEKKNGQVFDISNNVPKKLPNEHAMKPPLDSVGIADGEHSVSIADGEHSLSIADGEHSVSIADGEHTVSIADDEHSVQPAMIVLVDRTNQNKDYHGGVTQSEIMSKTSEKSVTKDVSEEAGRRIVKYVKTSNNFVKNNTEYATVKTEKISTTAKTSWQPSSHPGSRYLERALPLPPSEETNNGHPHTNIVSPPPPATSMPLLSTPSPHNIWTPPSPRQGIKQGNTSLHSTVKEEDLLSYSPESNPLSLSPWYQAIDRKTAEHLLKQLSKDGGFVVRDSKHGGKDSPYTLTVYNNNKVFNINIRTRSDGKISLGKEKIDEQVYPSIRNMVEHHTIQPLKLTAGDTGTQHSSTTLNCWPE